MDLGVSTDEGYRLTVTRHSDSVQMGTTSWTTTATTGYQPTTTFYTVSGLVAGIAYDVKLEWYNSTGGSEVELFTTLGTRTSWADSNGTAYPWSLVGDTSANSSYKYGVTVTGDAASGSAAILGTAPVAYWQCNETSGATLDNSGSGGSGGCRKPELEHQWWLHPGSGRPDRGLRQPEQRHRLRRVEPNGHRRQRRLDVAGNPLSNLGTFTVGGWIDPTVTPYQWEGIMGQNGVMSIGFYNSTTLMVQTNYGSITASYNYGINSWHYVSVVADASASDGHYAKLYINGSVVGYTTTQPTGGNWGTSTANPFQLAGDAIMRQGGTFIPGNTTGDGGWYTGRVDEVAIWTNALTASQETTFGAAWRLNQLHERRPDFRGHDDARLQHHGLPGESQFGLRHGEQSGQGPGVDLQPRVPVRGADDDDFAVPQLHRRWLSRPRTSTPARRGR